MHHHEPGMGDGGTDRPLSNQEILAEQLDREMARERRRRSWRRRSSVRTSQFRPTRRKPAMNS